MKKTTPLLIALSVLTLFSTQSLAKASASDESSLETRHLNSISDQTGKDFERAVGQVLDGSTMDLSKCLSAQTDLSKPLVIYFEVLKSGKTGAVTTFPSNQTAPCIKQQMQGLKFPSSAKDFLGKIRMTFNKEK